MFAVFAITRLEVNTMFIAAVLAIIGYSINDTIVCFDRIRENLKQYDKKLTKEKLKEIVNKSLQETFTRTIVTALTTIFCIIGLMLFGPKDIFAFDTAMIGDPSGRQDMRKMMTEEQIQHNVECFKKQMSRFIDFSDGKAILANNADWLLNLNYVDFLREVGACFSVNNMLRAECYKQRMEKGLSFLEFNYMIMQSYDFLMLYKKYGCNLQFGGDDQWSNMLGGTELIRKKLGKDASAMTITLLLNSEGKKMGKTQSGAVWLDPDKTSQIGRAHV